MQLKAVDTDEPSAAKQANPFWATLAIQEIAKSFEIPDEKLDLPEEWEQLPRRFKEGLVENHIDSIHEFIQYQHKLIKRLKTYIKSLERTG